LKLSAAVREANACGRKPKDKIADLAPSLLCERPGFSDDSRPVRDPVLLLSALGGRCATGAESFYYES
jgi:hypothetical protein